MSKQVDYITEIKKLLKCDGITHLTQRIIASNVFTSFGSSANYTCAVGPFKFFVKLVPYSLSEITAWKYPVQEHDTSTEIEVNIMRAIKARMIDTNITPHFAEILAIVRCDNIEKYITDKSACDQQHLRKIQPTNYPQSVLCTFLEFVKNKRAFDKFSLVYSECCEISFSNFVNYHLPALPSERDTLLISIIFQVYYTLAAVQHVWSSFRHGDLFERNIMIKLGDEDPEVLHSPHYLRYVYLGQVWNIPYYGFHVKIIDFGHAEIREEGIINKYIKRSGNIWVPDHITFITSIESLFTTYFHKNTQVLNNILSALNLLRLGVDVSRAVLYEHKNTFRTPKEALLLHVFNMFETSVDDNLVLHEYITK